MRRRRSRGVWLPSIGTALPDEAEDVANGRAFAINVATAQITTGILPVTFDQPQTGDDIGIGDTMSDIIGSEYVLQRIVGKLYAERQSEANPATGRDRNPAILFGAGFFVARANDVAVGGGQDTPIGSATEPERRDNYSPLETDTVREPWIWRRVWILGAAGRAPQFNAAIGGVSNPIPVEDVTVANNPASTSLYGSVADGPHIDSRVKRRVSSDNRLWFAVSACVFPFSDTPPEDAMIVNGYLDYRLFGSLRKARGTSAF